MKLIHYLAILLLSGLAACSTAYGPARSAYDLGYTARPIYNNYCIHYQQSWLFYCLFKGHMKLKKLLKISIMAVVGLLVLAATAIGMAYLRQDRLVAEAVKQFNSTFNGRFAIEGSHISPFENFPYVSIDLDHVQVYQHKDTAQAAAIDVAHVYVGFNLWSIITGGFEVKKIKLSNGTNNILSELLIERLTSSFAMTESHIKASLNNFAAFSAMTDYFTE